MKKTFTKLFSTGLLMGLTFIGLAVKAQTTSLTNTTGTQVAPATETLAPYAPKNDFKPADKDNGEKSTTTKAAAEDTSWKPQRRVWGYSFGDYYYDAHSPALTSTQGKENSFYQTPTYRNAFLFRRLYLGYDYEISKKFKAEVLLASEPTANTGVNGSTSIQNSDKVQ